ncbi:hypothetical protein Tco_0065829 [Tanacetum coccineum]
MAHKTVTYIPFHTMFQMKKTNEAWHDEGYEEDEMWRSGDEKTDYNPPYVNVKTFEVKKYSFNGGRSFICITDREDEAVPLGQSRSYEAIIETDSTHNHVVTLLNLQQLRQRFYALVCFVITKDKELAGRRKQSKDFC